MPGFPTGVRTINFTTRYAFVGQDNHIAILNIASDGRIYANSKKKWNRYFLHRSLIYKCLNSDLSELKTDTVGSGINIFTQATSADGYQTEKSGYLTIINGGSTSGALSVFFDSHEMIAIAGSSIWSSERISVYVRKGVTIKATSTMPTVSLYYFPYV